MSLNVSEVMDGIGVRLATISGLRVFDFLPDSVSPPAATVSFPEVIEFDSTMARGADEMTVPVHVLVGKVSDRSARDQLAAYAAGSGGSSVKAAIEGAAITGVDSVRVTEARFSVTTLGAQEFLTATFQVHCIG